MGEDIHSKTLVYSKVEKKYIDGLSLSTDPEYSSFGPLYTGRNYDLFSVFGSRRGDFPELSKGNYGIPDFLPKTYKAYLKDSSYYGYVWWTLLDFQKALKSYLKMMQDPKKFYADQDCCLDQIADGTFDMKAYDQEVTYVYRTLRQFLKTTEEIQRLPEEYEVYGKLLDVDKTVFLFYFDC